jgi:hypothetical protein
VAAVADVGNNGQNAQTPKAWAEGAGKLSVFSKLAP